MEQDDEDDFEGLEEKQIQHEAGPSLLPGPIANAISLVTRSSSLYLRLGTFIGGLALDGARVTTLTGLELSRAIIEGVLCRAGRDVASRSLGDLGRKDSEGLLERSIATLHSTITHISFAASTGFYISSAALSSAGDLSQQLLSALDSILGSTDSSRAIASIITLIRREFENPATGQPGEKVGLSDLLMGVCGLALLQSWCKRLTDLEVKEQRIEEVIWDVVILDDGRRADVVSSSNNDKTLAMRDGSGEGEHSRGGSTFNTLSGNDEIIHTIQHGDNIDDDDSEGEWPEISLKEKIMQTLPADASVSITTEVSTTKTITVEITGAQPSDLSPPPGVEIIEENAHHGGEINVSGQVLTNEEKIALLVPRYRVVYRTIRNRLRGTNITGADSEAQVVVDDDKKTNAISSSGRISEDTDAQSKDRSTDDLIDTKLNEQAPNFMMSPFSSPEPEEMNEKEYIDLKLPQQNTEPQPLESTMESSITSPAANQKRPRKPMSISSVSGSETPTQSQDRSRPPLPKKMKSDASEVKKKGTLRNALRKGSATTLSNLWNKEPPPVPEKPTITQKAVQTKPPWGGARSPPHNKPKSGPASKSNTSSHIPVPHKASSNTTNRSDKSNTATGRGIIPARDPPRAPQRGNPNYFSSRDLGQIVPSGPSRSPSRASYYSIHERRRDSMVSQTDTYSIHSSDTRPGSPTAFRTHLRTQSSLMRTKSEKNVSLNVPTSPSRNHRRAKSYVPSIYTLKTNNSETSLVLAPHLTKGAYDGDEALHTLSRTGIIDDMFPQHHIVRNITRFVRFASASYGSHFMRVMGITSTPGSQKLGVDQDHHYEHHSFSHHTQLPASTILLSSFVDPQGGTDSTGETNTGVPMVHFISLDHESRAVVLTCRGTLGFEDVLTDMTCDYDDLIVRGKAYKVHKGIHASAVRLLSGRGSRVLATLAAALEEFPDYGLVMCGHSLGGGVVSLLAIMISEQASPSFSFVTSTSAYRPNSPLLLTSSTSDPGAAPYADVRLPSGRPIHVYAYGPPATLSSSLRLATRGLITTIINGQDLVPYLSLGVLHDLQAIALAFKTDDKGAKGEVRARVWAGLTSGFADKWYGGRSATGASEEDDEWAYAALKTLRASMLSHKLVPPGECFIVETTPVLQRDAFVAGANEGQGAGLGRPATRAVLRYVRGVDARFAELHFGGSMLLDHSPGRYEASLAALGKGVLG